MSTTVEIAREAEPAASARASESTETRGDGLSPRELQGLKGVLVALVDEDRRRRVVQEAARQREEEELAALRAKFERAASAWMKRAVPRLEMLQELLPAEGAIERAESGWKVAVVYPPNHDFPVAASLTVEIAPVNGFRAGRITIEPLLIPMLQGHPNASAREFAADGPADGDLARFLDQGVVAFARAYLHVRDPESPYRLCRSPA